MMILHFRNFKVKSSKKYDEIAYETDDILHLNLIEDSQASSSVLAHSSSRTGKNLIQEDSSLNRDGDSLLRTFDKINKHEEIKDGEKQMAQKAPFRPKSHKV